MYSKAQYIAGNSNVKSAMIYRCLFDETLMWLVESGAKTQYEVGGDSTDWSNQRNSSFYYYATATASNTVYINSYPGERIPTGAKAGSNSNNWKRNCANNIYDLAGNVWDWSQCWYDYTEDEGKRVYCGGVCSLGLAAGTNAINFYESPEVKSDEVGCRVFLIIV